MAEWFELSGGGLGVVVLVLGRIDCVHATGKTDDPVAIRFSNLYWVCSWHKQNHIIKKYVMWDCRQSNVKVLAWEIQSPVWIQYWEKDEGLFFLLNFVFDPYSIFKTV